MDFNLVERSSGVLLHLSSLPGPHYNGDLGTGAREFIDFLQAAGQRWWQMLPVNPIGPGNSPYSTISSFAGESLFINLDQLVADGWLKKSEISKPQASNAKAVNFTAARSYRNERLKIAINRASTSLPNEKSFQKFMRNQHYWLSDYLMFRVICDECGTPDWHLWPKPLRDRETKALNDLMERRTEEMLRYAIEQFWFFNQWSALKSYANEKGIGLIGDLPIFVSHASADVWSHRQYFRLGADKRPTVVAGCPPDAFNADGQLWGNALYDWSALQKDRFSWWIQRLGGALNLFDAVRLDHFIGFSRYWEIKAGEKTARNGRWIPVPGDAFFSSVSRTFKNPQFIAEDLGAVTPQIRALRDKFGFPGMKVSQFAFDGTEEATHHVPHTISEKSVAYTGTHDNNTTRGWFQALEKSARSGEKKAKVELKRVQVYLDTNAAKVSWDLIRQTMASNAGVTIFPVQDLLNEGGYSRMNIPGVAKGNWKYRVRKSAFSKDLTNRLAQTTEVFGRTRSAVKKSSQKSIGG